MWDQIDYMNAGNNNASINKLCVTKFFESRFKA